MKTKLTILLFLLLATIDVATAEAQTLVIWQNDGSKVYYALDDQPKTTFTSDELVITTSKVTISYPLRKVQRYTYEKGSQGINDVKSQGISITHKGDEIIVSGLPQGKSVIVYGLDGKQIITKRSDGSAHQILSLSQLPTGVFIIKAESVTYKIAKH